MTAAYQIRLGQKAWLEGNYRELQELEKKYKGDIEISTSDLQNFEISLRGRGKFKRHSLRILCLYPTPAQPPKFKLLNEGEMGRLGHPHIRDVYVCLKQPWTPRTPLKFPVLAIAQAWWRPQE